MIPSDTPQDVPAAEAPEAPTDLDVELANRLRRFDRQLISVDQRLDQILAEQKTTAQVQVAVVAGVMLLLFYMAKQAKARGAVSVEVAPPAPVIS